MIFAVAFMYPRCLPIWLRLSTRRPLPNFIQLTRSPSYGAKTCFERALAFLTDALCVVWLRFGFGKSESVRCVGKDERLCPRCGSFQGFHPPLCGSRCRPQLTTSVHRTRATRCRGRASPAGMATPGPRGVGALPSRSFLDFRGRLSFWSRHWFNCRAASATTPARPGPAA